MVPFVDLTRLEPGFLPAWLEIVGKASATAGFAGGASVAAPERDLAADHGVSHVVTCANGRDALHPRRWSLPTLTAGCRRGFRSLGNCVGTRVPLVNDGAQCYGVQIDGRGVYADAMIATTACQRPLFAVVPCLL